MADFASASVPTDSPTADAGSPAAPVVGGIQEVTAAVVSAQPGASEADAAAAPKTETALQKAAKELRRGMKGKRSVKVDAPPDAEVDAPAEAQDGSQELEAEKPEAKPEAKVEDESRSALAMQRSALRRHEAKVQRQLAELRSQSEQLQAMRAELEPWRQLAEGAAKDPGKTLGELAARAGISERAFLEQLTRKHLGKPADAASLATELEQLRAEVAADRKARDQQAQQASERARFQEARTRDISAIVEGLADPAAAEDFPFASSLDADTLQEEVAKAVDACYQHMPTAGYADVVRLIDTHLREEASRFRKNEKLWSRIATFETPGTVPAKPRPPIAGVGANPTAKANRTTVSNRDAAASAATGPLSAEQRMAMAAQELRKGMR
jgi:hypothetical protein